MIGRIVRLYGTGQLSARWRGLSAWWLAGLFEVLPHGWLGWIRGHAVPRLLVCREGDSVLCEIQSVTDPAATTIPLRSFNAPSLNAWLANRNLTRSQIRMGAKIDRKLFFVRDLKLPLAAKAALPRILDQEVLRRTPFQPDDILHSATMKTCVSADILSLHHWIVRKDRAEQALTEFGLHLSDVDYLATSDVDNECSPVIWLCDKDQEDPQWARQAIKILAVGALGAVIFGALAFDWCQSSVANGLEMTLGETREKALGGDDHGSFNQTAQLFARKANVSILEIWNELSRLLPDHTFLTEARLGNGEIAISGLSADAARLVRLIDDSPLFTEATLAAGITPDAKEHKDRFSITFKVRNGRSISIPSKGAKPRDVSS
jgi:general secretion pathway protein L